MKDPMSQDAIALASQLGRLDLVSLLLTIVGITIIVVGWIAYIDFRNLAQSRAETVAKDIAEKVAERAANEYLQRELPDVVETYADYLKDSDPISDQSAEELSSTQEETGGRS